MNFILDSKLKLRDAEDELGLNIFKIINKYILKYKYILLKSICI